jgi:hypothetical protein
MKSPHLLPGLAALLLAGCGGQSTNNSTLSIATEAFDIPPGDSLTCFYTSTTTSTELTVGDATGSQGPGGHHIIVYYTDTPQTPTHHPCTDAEMISWHQIAGASTGGEPVIAMPEGGAIKVPPGKQLVVQSHYINTTGATKSVSDTINLQLLDPKNIQQYINYWVINDDQFSVPPMGTAKSVSTCTFPQDVKTVVLLGHMHAYGAHYTLERVDAQGNTLETVYDQAWQPLYMTHPPLLTNTLAEPHDIVAGTIYRQTCSWNNLTTNPLVFPDEMCVAFGYYFPDNGWIDCNVTHQ